MAKQMDLLTACLTGVLFVLLEWRGHPILPMVQGGCWLFTLMMVALIIACVTLQYPLTALVVTLILIRFIYHMRTRSWEQARMDAYREAAIADVRFDPNLSVDMEMADGTLNFQPIRTLAMPSPKGPLLLFPPTADQLAQIGSGGM